jgi:hypothetical protein
MYKKITNINDKYSFLAFSGSLAPRYSLCSSMEMKVGAKPSLKRIGIILLNTQLVVFL